MRGLRAAGRARSPSRLRSRRSAGRDRRGDILTELSARFAQTRFSISFKRAESGGGKGFPLSHVLAARREFLDPGQGARDQLSFRVMKAPANVFDFAGDL